MRLFIAVQISEEMRGALVRCMHELKKQGVEGNYVPAQNLHMTLAFIGEYDNLGHVKEILKKVPLPEFKMTLADKGNFGNVLWAGVKGNQRLKTYVKDLRSALRVGGIPCDQETFIPHITLVRKSSAKKPYRIQIPKLEMTVKKVSLMKSEEQNGKVRYKEICNIDKV